jgi:hypothetical protein
MPDQYTFEHETMRELRRLALNVTDEPTRAALFSILQVVYDLAEAQYRATRDGQ